MSLVPVYRSRPSALHAARAGAGAGALRGARAHRRALPAPADPVGRARGDRPGRRARRRGPRDRPLAPLRAPVRAADRRDQPARLPGGRHAPLPRRRGARPRDRHHARGHRRGRLQRAPRDRDRHRVRPAVGRRRPGRAAADVPARVLPLGAHGDARHPARPGARARRRPDERRRPLPPASARAAGGGARRAGRRARPGGGRGRGARGARLLARRADAASAAAVVAPRLARGRGPRWSLAVLSVAGAVAGVGSVEPYPTLQIETGSTEVVLSCAGAARCRSRPFAGRAARLGVARG